MVLREVLMTSTLSRRRPSPPFPPDRAFSMPRAAASSLAEFRRWYASDSFPEEGRISYLGGEIFVDMGHERLSSHVSLKGELARALITLAEELNIGQFFTDGVRVVNVTADLSSEPDGCLVTWSTAAAGRVQLQRSADGADVTEVVGAPDLVLEIVSPSSERKDTSLLPELYHRAGIPEYWLIDARDDEEIKFDVLNHTPSGYTPAPDESGWRRSAAFGRKVRLERSRNPLGIWQFRLLVEPTG
jgi:Uma2 family endonuclease